MSQNVSIGKEGNPQRGDVGIEFGGKRYHLRFNFTARAKFEEWYGAGARLYFASLLSSLKRFRPEMVSGLPEIDLAEVREYRDVQDTALFLAACLQREIPGATADHVITMMDAAMESGGESTEALLVGLQVACLQAYLAAKPKGEDIPEDVRKEVEVADAAEEAAKSPLKSGAS